MRIVTLVENLVYKQGLAAEHGLSVYIETENKKILFDTGQSAAFINNAKLLGINVAEIDAVIISHGHYDHTGGLYPFLKQNSKALVFVKEELFVPKYHGNDRFIGICKDELLLKNRLFYIDKVTEIEKDVFIMPDIKIYEKLDTHFKGLNIKDIEGLKTDEFSDELFLAIKSNNQINVVTACSHRGITNICKTAVGHFNLPPGLILGGFHLKDCSLEQYNFIIEYFKSSGTQSIGVCHCTGVEKFANMQHDLNMHVFYNYTGHEIILP
ncbi:MAG: MBL fold metallo-hydrolase [Bacteroidales bacterium]|nr:MBL fold metallo-hydrolase [Bacteroidales bacterium]